MNLLMIGAGSIGLLLTAKLAPRCDHFTLLTRSENQAKEMTLHGVKLDGQTIEAAAALFQSFESYCAEESQIELDFIVLTVKQSALDDNFLSKVASLMGASTKVVCFQNGMGHIERISEYVDAKRIVAAVTTEGALRTSPTSVNHTGVGITYVGYVSGFDDTNMQDLVQLLQSAGFHVEGTPTIMEKVWGKVVINSIINPLTAVLNVENGVLLEDPSIRSTMRSLFEEALLAVRSEGIELDESLWDQVIEVCRRTAANTSSMRQDLLAGRITEIDWINGALLRTGAKHGYSLPVHATMCNLVKANEGLRSGGG
ncbi:ketopantoate reductase family protein [Paenibacillus sp. KN14-4R]|uniref:ketopantoate reductase family protein n=1 Tax=Paenibacillus sp. KN14-4R TaxID=3445773 RepID=UPI003FA11303